MNETRSNVCHAACDGWCSVSTTATADDAATVLTFSRTASAEAESSPDVGFVEEQRLGFSHEFRRDRQAALLAAGSAPSTGSCRR